MKLIKIGLLIALFISGKVNAQHDVQRAGNQVVLKFAPLALFDLDNTFQFGVEIPFGQTGFAMQQDLGYGKSDFNMWYYETTNPPNKSIYKSRTNIRYYFLERPRVRGHIGLEYMFKNVRYLESQWVGRDCLFGNCGYFENKDFTVGRFVNAGHMKIGWQFYFAGRMTMDLFTGIGMRDIKVRMITPGFGDARIISPHEPFASTTPGMRDFVPSLAVGFHLGLVLGKLNEY